jgi:cell division protein FtsI/penicillin-binding protein 2
LSRITHAAQRRRRLVTRAAPLIVVATAAFVTGVVAGAGSGELDAARRFVAAWEAGDTGAMYAQLSATATETYPEEEFAADYDQAERTATILGVDVGTVDRGRDATGATAAVVPLTFETNAFGSLEGKLVLPLAEGKVEWDPSLVFPGLASDEQLARRTRIPTRAAILAKDGTPLAEGPATARSSPLGSAATAVTGAVSAPDGSQREELTTLGFPAGALTGTSGLELAFNDRLSGRPGGELLAEGGAAGTRVLAQSQPLPGKPVHTTIDPALQQSAVADLGATYGGVVALDAKTGDVRAVAGLAYSAPQPPGSTFKLVTTTAALDAGVVKTSDQFEYQSGVIIDGRLVSNADGEVCGGTFVQAFADSCNSVFVPLGPKLGSDRLVSAAELYGFNAPPTLYDADALRAVNLLASTIPEEISTDLDLGVSAIGQGKVLATPLEMASVAQTISNGGMRSPTSLVADRGLRPEGGQVRVTSAKTAATLRSLMIGVVTSGTGTAAAITGVTVAGKTGTAELGPATLAPGTDPGSVKQRVDAWFTCFAPASDPKLVVAVMVVDAAGAGGTVAAPIARAVLASGLGLG